MLEQFNDDTLEIIKSTIEYTYRHYKINKVGTESFLYVMFKEEDSICNLLLEDYRVSLEEIEKIISKYVLIRNNNKEYTDKFMEVVEMAKVIARDNNSKEVFEEHLLYALLLVRDTIFEHQITKLNLNPVILIEDLKAYFDLKNESEMSEYSINLTNLAKENKLGKLIGRKDYLERMKIILSRKTKNNVLLIGSAGVGKTALVEGLCYDLIEEKSNYNIISLNVSSLVANTKYRGDFEARINNVLNEATEIENSIIFIDEIHTIVGAGSSDNLLDIANIIKPYLARNSFKCIGATTIEEYHKTIEKDKALARRFQTIFVNELDDDETYKVLSGIKQSYIDFHGVDISNQHIFYIINLASEKIANRKFPDKAIDLMDEAMCIAKRKGNCEIDYSDIDEALKNITGSSIGNVNHEYQFEELLPFVLDNIIGVKTKNPLLLIKFSGNDKDLQKLIDEIKLGFGITNEMILKLNLSSYSESHSISSLIGTPPGYIGYEDGGLLSEHFSKFIYQVVVIDKIEEASPTVVDFFYSTIEKGFFYDKKGREFKTNNSIFIFTNSNNKETSLGFINQKTSEKAKIQYDLIIDSKKEVKKVNPYIEIFKNKGFEISFDEDDFSKYPLEYKKKMLTILQDKKRGKYYLKYLSSTNEIEVFQK